ncbi:hypothetical protein, partial [Plasmodium yoelii yoelii]
IYVIPYVTGCFINFNLNIIILMIFLIFIIYECFCY